MPTVGIRQFREDLASYVDSPVPVQVTRHGQVIGVFVPTEPTRPFDREGYLAAGMALQAEMAAKGIDPEDLIKEFDELRRAERKTSTPPEVPILENQ